jgi:hypothetical protein
VPFAMSFEGARDLSVPNKCSIVAGRSPQEKEK